MEKETLIMVKSFCSSCSISTELFHQLKEYGLIVTIEQDDIEYLNDENLMKAEQFIRLHKTLHINMEGLDVVAHLLDKINRLEEELRQFRH